MKHAVVASALLFTGAAAQLPGPPHAVASVSGYANAAIRDKNRPAEDVARDADRKPADMVAFAGIKPGDKVVDLIPGKGYFTRIFAKVVGPHGHVYAYVPSELDETILKGKPPTVIAITDDKARYPNVSLIRAPVAKFATPQPVDVVWTSQNYHDMHDTFMGPVDLSVANKAIYDALKPGGVYIVLDHAASPGSGLRDTNTLHRIDPEAVKKEVTAAGFEFAGETDVLKNAADPHTANVFDKSIRGKTDQFVLKFRKPSR